MASADAAYVKTEIAKVKKVSKADPPNEDLALLAPWSGLGKDEEDLAKGRSAEAYAEIVANVSAAATAAEKLFKDAIKAEEAAAAKAKAAFDSSQADAKKRSAAEASASAAVAKARAALEKAGADLASALEAGEKAREATDEAKTEWDDKLKSKGRAQERAAAAAARAKVANEVLAAAARASKADPTAPAVSAGQVPPPVLTKEEEEAKDELSALAGDSQPNELFSRASQSFQEYFDVDFAVLAAKDGEFVEEQASESPLDAIIAAKAPGDAK
mmetsp:Transcript_27876/g.62209  ORF Transcript_27876/g.62209 Transcript_27876/m.62209 type:complete len:273 (+) Transcript_27876:432-1250(+)